ncbi:MAG: HAD-IIIC family phosphatase [Candidatus Zapsychrus exili]|nr:HAD-IIIC family phosphatase [Candidatus Zapsychrus exili]
MNINCIKDSIEKASLHHLMKAINDFKKDDSSGLEEAKVHVLRNHTIDNIKPFLKGLGILSQLNIDTVIGDYDAFMQEILDDNSALYASKPDVVVLSLVLENFISSSSNEFGYRNIVDRIDQIIKAISTRSSSLILCNTFLMPLYNHIGAASFKDGNSYESIIAKVNLWLREQVLESSNIYLVDFNQIEQRIGSDNVRDRRMWYVARSLFKNAFIKEYATEIVNIIKVLKGKVKKCLVLDCDNTLWGGVLGEEGIDGIKLDKYEYPGNIYYSFQQDILKLMDSGTILALSSKNNEADVFEVLDNHKYCLIKRKYLSACRINWGNKPENILSIAKELSLGVDSFVFVDDSPLECEMVKQMIPDVAVIQVPEDLSKYSTALLKDGLFASLAKSSEDKNRTNMYVTETKRKQVQKQFDNLDDFLSSLELVAEVSKASDSQIQRVAQLTQKTNQFNLTTKRYSEVDIKSFVDNKDYDVLYLNLKDKFGEYGSRSFYNQIR